MPLFQTIHVNANTKILVWKITESFEALLNAVELKEKSANRLRSMKSEQHQKGFLSVRMLLKELNLNDFDLHYDSFGKPFLDDHRYISITHSKIFSAVIISEQPVGIDIELQREKILKIADKFVEKEYLYLEKEDQHSFIKMLTVIWGAKEAIFKIQNEKGISFKNHIEVHPFNLNDSRAAASLRFNDSIKNFTLEFLEFEGFTLVYAL